LNGRGNGNAGLAWSIVAPRFSFFDLGMGALIAASFLQFGFGTAVVVFLGGSMLSGILVGITKRNARSND